MKYLKAIMMSLFVAGILLYSIFTSSTTISIHNKYFVVDYAKELEKYSSEFVAASKEFGVPASLLMALSIHETSVGTTGVGKQNNLFGVRVNSKYPTPDSCTSSFECYASTSDSIRDAARILSTPTLPYKVTNIIINNGGISNSYEDVAKSITSHWCTEGCTYDYQTLLDDIQIYGLTKYDKDLAGMSTQQIKNLLDDLYGPGASAIKWDKPQEPEKPQEDDEDKEQEEEWDGKYDIPNLDDYESIYLNTLYTGDITQGYIYKKYSEEPLWTELTDDSDEYKVLHIIKLLFKQGEKLYGDKKLHLEDFQFNGTTVPAPILDILVSTGVLPAESGNFANWKQFNYPDTPLGNSNQTIKSAGCLVTSVAIQMARAGVNTAYGKSFDPRVFVEHLNANGGFTGANFYWNSPSDSGFAKDFKYVDKVTVTGDLGSELGKKMAEGYYPVLRVKYGSEQHWVAVYGASSGSVSIYDPAKSSNNLYESYSNRSDWTVAYYKVGG